MSRRITKKIQWYQCGAEWRADMPGNVTLVASPDRVAQFGTKPARGTKWHAQASHWDEATRTMSRYGADIYGTLFDDAKAARKAAEQLYAARREAGDESAEMVVLPPNHYTRTDKIREELANDPHCYD